MKEFEVTPDDLAKMQLLATVSSWKEGKVAWTTLSMFYRDGFRMPIVAVVEGFTRENKTRDGMLPGDEARRFSFKFLCVPSVVRALEWFDDSELTDAMRAMVMGAQGEMAEAVKKSTRFDVLPDLGGKVIWGRRPTDDEAVTIRGAIVKALDEATIQGIRSLTAQDLIRYADLGYTGPARITEALEWLYPADELPGLIGRAYLAERDFGIGQRTVNNALAEERDGGTARGPWVKPFVAALRYFDRGAWLAVRQLKEHTDVKGA